MHKYKLKILYKLKVKNVKFRFMYLGKFKYNENNKIR